MRLTRYIAFLFLIGASLFVLTLSAAVAVAERSQGSKTLSKALAAEVATLKGATPRFFPLVRSKGYRDMRPFLPLASSRQEKPAQSQIPTLHPASLALAALRKGARLAALKKKHLHVVPSIPHVVKDKDAKQDASTALATLEKQQDHASIRTPLPLSLLKEVKESASRQQAQEETLSELLQLATAVDGPVLRIPPPAIPKVLLKNYKLIVRVGKGSFGRVYLARHIKSGQFVAIKIFADLEADEYTDHYRYSEYPILSHLAKTAEPHPNIISLLAVSFSRINRAQIKSYTSPDLVFPYMQHGDIGVYARSILETGLHRSRPLSAMQLKVIRSFASQLINGLAFLEKNYIIHRDLKPANILLDADMTLKIADFGLAINMKDRKTEKSKLAKLVYTSWQVDFLSLSLSFSLSLSTWNKTTYPYPYPYLVPVLITRICSL